MANDSAIAIVGMAGRFPGARNVSEFWQNLKNGVESIRPFSDAELLAAGVSPEDLAQPEYVKSGVLLEDFDKFDAGFFGFSPKDAAIMDPQHRFFLECAWEALEHAGHVPDTFGGSIGVYAGSGLNSYMIHNLLTNEALMKSAGLFLIKQTGNDKDVLATRTSYQLDLRGPSINVQTACSTSLVAVHMACQSLLNQECDMALAGGVTIEFPQGRGYMYREGEILSRDGHCRAFDADSSGTVFSSGVGIVVLRRLEDALADNDTIYAQILGTAINNDGSRKAGFLAPSVEGQAEVIAEALGVAGVEPKDISYVETHGTGTKVGDPIEVKALTQAYRDSNRGPGSCAIGSLKTNIGHLDTAAGVAGLIKTTLALHNKQIPPTVHFQKPNPLIDFASGPFYPNAKLQPWNIETGVRRAGVTSLGIGGTNAHVILEEAPEVVSEPLKDHGQNELVVLSAKSEAALSKAAENLANFLEATDASLRDIAGTLQIGRKHFPYRRAVVAASNQEAGQLLRSGAAGRVFSGHASAKAPEVVFMFSGQGSQHVNMGRDLYETEPVFRSSIDFCAERLIPELGLDLRTLLFPQDADASAAAEKLSQTRYTQPALFTIEYSLAQWWKSRGITPSAMIGHSIGEYVAATMAGVFSVTDALRITATRGRLMDEMPRGSMLSIATRAESLTLPKDLSVAVVNGPEQCVVAGPSPAIEQYAKELKEAGVTCRVLQTSHAFHSAMMEPMLESFRREMASVTFKAPKIPYISNISGTWVKPEEATSPEYWVRQLRNAVQFSSGLEELFRDPSRAFLEIGPGQVLTSLARQHPARSKTSRVFASMRHPQEQVSDDLFLMNTAGQMWISGCAFDWKALQGKSSPRRIALPTYPFEHQRHWIEPGASLLVAKPAPARESSSATNADSWFHQRVWKRTPAEQSAAVSPCCWLVFNDELGLGNEIIKHLKSAGHEVIQVVVGKKYERTGAGKYAIVPGEREHYDKLLADIEKNEKVPAKILHLWPLAQDSIKRTVDDSLNLSFYSLLFLAQALGDQDIETELTSVSNGLQPVAGEKIFEPSRAALLGVIRVLPKEFSRTVCRYVDFDWNLGSLSKTADTLLTECALPPTAPCIVHRGADRYVEAFEPAELRTRAATRLKSRGVYWITGGMGGIGFAIAEHLARTVQARLVLTSRTPVPPRNEWDRMLSDAATPSSLVQKITKLRELETLGAEVLLLEADVSNSHQMQQVVRSAKSRFGSIDGVIHAAGLIEDEPLQTKSRASAARVLNPKIQGTLVLRDVLRDTKLDFFLLFSSISSLTPPAGQVDYAGANAFLDAFAQSEPSLPAAALNWSLWTDVGMGSRGRKEHPIVGRRIFQSASESLFSTRLDYEKDWLVKEHRFKNGEALVPGTGYLQLAAAAIAQDKFEPGIEFNDVFFLAPLSVAPGEARDVRVRLRAQRAGFRFSVLAKNNEWTEHASGLVQRNEKKAPADLNLSEIIGRCISRRIDFDVQHRTKQERYFEFGPRWQNLRSLQIGNREAVATLRLDGNYASDLSVWQMHPALLDLATGSSLYLIEGYDTVDAVYLPLSYKKITFYRPLVAEVFSHIRSRQDNTSQREIVSFDLTLTDSNGRVIAEIQEFSLRRMAASADRPTPVFRRSVVEKDDDLVEIVQQGISTEDGIKIFDQILASDIRPNLIIAKGGVAHHSVDAASKSSTQQTASKDAGVEAILAEWWQELLGVEAVGLDDDFFDLGGHSLIAVRLFSKIKKTFKLDLGLSTLFEARTIRQLAKLIDQDNTHEDAKPSPATATPAVVPVRQQGTRLPIFLISGLGGEVIGFQKLARNLGDDQPVFALQPQGLDGRQPFLTRIEDMAAYYLREIREVRPNGPYCLAGYSFGGYVVFEIAQQLLAQGEDVAMLGFLDTIEWQYLEAVRSSATLSERWKLRLQRVKQRPWQYFREAVLDRLIAARLRKLLYKAFVRIGREIPQSLSTLENINRFAMSLYRPTPYPGRLTIFRSVTRTQLRDSDELLGWGKLVSGGIDVEDVPGRHTDILEEPNVIILAEKMRSTLDRVQQTLATAAGKGT